MVHITYSIVDSYVPIEYIVTFYYSTRTRTHTERAPISNITYVLLYKDTLVPTNATWPQNRGLFNKSCSVRK